jgi:hypothetical protein
MVQLERGEIVVERLTGTRVIVIHAADSVEEVTVRFPDGRMEDRYQFELARLQSVYDLLRDLVAASLEWPAYAVEYGSLPGVARRYYAAA